MCMSSAGFSVCHDYTHADYATMQCDKYCAIHDFCVEILPRRKLKSEVAPNGDVHPDGKRFLSASAQAVEEIKSHHFHEQEKGDFPITSILFTFFILLLLKELPISRQ